ncbi:MAG: hypothetical protein DHS20C16_28800 [Phycisphaerae bacterium]|nr:MAG: hypothetical protein DHS20C16_28800 [Phycisphaerae bacterium]
MWMPLLCTMALGILQPNAIEISAKIDAEQLKVGETYHVTFDWDLPADASVENSGIPVPLIQIEVPKSIELVGEVLKEHKALAKNEFLHAPFERALESKSTRIEFKLLEAPTADDRIAINFVAYVDSEDGTSQFVRKRLAVPVVAHGAGVEVEVGDASWSGNGFVKIGEKVKAISLPQADGTQVDLAELIGKSNIIITTYRAFW